MIVSKGLLVMKSKTSIHYQRFLFVIFTFYYQLKGIFKLIISKNCFSHLKIRAHVDIFPNVLNSFYHFYIMKYQVVGWPVI